jgi:hypothetical protein
LSRLPLLALGWVLGAAGLLALLQRDAPLFLNLGPGDEAYARGFRDRWERDGKDEATIYRGSLDGARIEWPVEVAGRITARLRLARHGSTPAEVTLTANGRIVETWTQGPQGWRVREFDLGEIDGPLRLQFRSSSSEGELGIALDWVELRGARRAWAREWGGLVALLLGLPVLLAVGLGLRPGLIGGLVLLAVAALAIGLDRMGGLVALDAAGVPALLIGCLVLALHRLLARIGWLEREAVAPSIAALVAAAALVAFSHPGCYYPDVDTHARMLGALRADPLLAIDPTRPWNRLGAQTREIGGQRVGIPYSFGFHALAWPLASWLGDVAALRTLAVGCLAATLLLTAALARSGGLPRGPTLLAPLLLAALPVTASRLGLALWPTLLGQAAMLAVVVGLARHGVPGDRRRALGLLAGLALAQAVYTGSLIVAGSFVVALALVLLLGAGEGRAALRLVALHALATVAVLVVMYAGFASTLLGQVLPGLGGGAAPDDALAVVAGRIPLFFGPFLLLLFAAPVALRRSPARLVLLAAALAALGMLAGRLVVPALFRDAKEVEFAAPIVAVGAAAAWAWLRSRRRLLADIALAGCLAWSVLRSIDAYAGLFHAAGRG